ncbi:hypothetical protein HK101_005358, partial [Irineochytrium annulatum]
SRMDTAATVLAFMGFLILLLIALIIHILVVRRDALKKPQLPASPTPQPWSIARSFFFDPSPRDNDDIERRSLYVPPAIPRCPSVAASEATATSFDLRAKLARMEMDLQLHLDYPTQGREGEWGNGVLTYLEPPIADEERPPSPPPTVVVPPTDPRLTTPIRISGIHLPTLYHRPALRPPTLPRAPAPVASLNQPPRVRFNSEVEMHAPPASSTASSISDAEPSSRCLADNDDQEDDGEMQPTGAAMRWSDYLLRIYGSPKPSPKPLPPPPPTRSSWVVTPAAATPRLSWLSGAFNSGDRKNDTSLERRSSHRSSTASSILSFFILPSTDQVDDVPTSGQTSPILSPTLPRSGWRPFADVKPAKGAGDVWWGHSTHVEIKDDDAMQEVAEVEVGAVGMKRGRNRVRPVLPKLIIPGGKKVKEVKEVKEVHEVVEI